MISQIQIIHDFIENEIFNSHTKLPASVSELLDIKPHPASVGAHNFFDIENFYKRYSLHLPYQLRLESKTRTARFRTSENFI